MEKPTVEQFKQELDKIENQRKPVQPTMEQKIDVIYQAITEQKSELTQVLDYIFERDPGAFCQIGEPSEEMKKRFPSIPVTRQVWDLILYVEHQLNKKNG